MKPVVMLTMAQLARFGERSVRLYLLQRMPGLKRGPACVIPWEGPHQEARSREGGNWPSDQRSGLSNQQGTSP